MAPLATHLAGIAIEGCQADEGANFPTGQLPQIGHFGGQSGDGGWADTAHAGKPLGQVGMMGFDVLGKFSLDLIELGANCHSHGLDALPGRGVTDRQPLALGHLHGDKLPPACHHGLQRLLLWRALAWVKR